MSKTLQPEWRNVGEFSPTDNIKTVVFEDLTGNYQPEIHLSLFYGGDIESRTIVCERYTIVCEKCTYINGILSDNKFHPDKPAWFADSVNDFCDFQGVEREKFIQDITGEDVMNRAHAWYMIGNYHGFDNLDAYPDVSELTKPE